MNSSPDMKTPQTAPSQEIQKSNLMTEEKRPPDPAASIPNGGLTAWLQVVGAFFLFFNSWGIVNTYGVFQSYYEANILSSQSSSNISWIGSIQAFLLLIVGILTGPIYDAGFFRTLIMVGSFLVVFGMMMTSLCKQYWQVMLAQGITVGLGSGCLFIPSVAIVSTYFSTKKSFATGIAASGSSLGGVIYPIIFHQLQSTIGFPWATRILAFIMLATLALSITVMKVRIQPSKTRSLLDRAAFTEPPFTLFSLGEFFGFMGLYIPFFYITTFATANGVTNPTLAFYLLIILNASSIFGRIIPNFLADKTGPLNMLIPCSAISALLAFIWLGIKTEAGIIIFAILYGFFSGTFVSLPPTTVVSLSPSMGVVGTRMGMSFTFAGFGLLVGNPVAGAILGRGDWKGLQAFCGATVVLALVCMIAARLAKVRGASSWKA